MKPLPGQAYQQVWLYFIKLHALVLLIGRKQSERHQIHSTAGHQKLWRQTWERIICKIKDEKIHLTRRDSTEKRDKSEWKQQWETASRARPEQKWRDGEEMEGTVGAWLGGWGKRGAEFLPMFRSCFSINENMNYIKMKKPTFTLCLTGSHCLKPVLSLAVHVLDLLSWSLTNHNSLEPTPCSFSCLQMFL